MKNNLKDYKKFYSESSYWKKLKKFAQKAGISVVYAALLLYYALQNPKLPKKYKGIILGALGYFILPVDAIPDFIPLVGFSDDLGVLLLAIGHVAMHIDDETKKRAKKKLKEWFQSYDAKDFKEVEEKLHH